MDIISGHHHQLDYDPLVIDRRRAFARLGRHGPSPRFRLGFAGDRVAALDNSDELLKFRHSCLGSVIGILTWQ